MSTTELPGNPASSELFGHPRGLAFLFATEMWERFSYYGMRALLVLYLVKHLFLPEQAERVIGYSALKGALETVFGPLAIQPFASHIYGSYTALVYLTPIFGGLLADRLLGQRRMVIIGAVLMAIGHFLMAFEQLLFFALAFLILGNGAFKPNISTQVGHLYAPGDARRDRAFSIFYVGVNVGAFFSPLVCGSLAAAFGWHYGFAAAGVGMLIGLATYLSAGDALPSDRHAEKRDASPLTADERRGLIALAVLFLPTTLFWATYEQQGNTIALWAEDFTRRTLDLGVWHGDMPAEWFQSFNPFMIFAFTPVIVALWAWQSARGREPSTVMKMALGCFGVTLANVVMVAAAWGVGSELASPLWLTAFFAILTVGELYLSPTSLSIVTKIAPMRIQSTVMGLSFLSVFVGNFMSGWLGSFWSSMTKPAFFLMIAAAAALAGIAIVAVRRPLEKNLAG